MTATPDAATSNGNSIAERLDRLSLTSLHVKVILLCSAGLAVDIGEVALSNTFSAIFLSPPYNAPRDSISLLLGAVFAGGAAGAPLFGWFADRYGRRAALQLSLLVLVVSSLAVVSSPGIGWMTLFRFVSGLALGGYPPLTAACLADLLPPQRRGTNMMLCAAFAFLGAPALPDPLAHARGAARHGRLALGLGRRRGVFSSNRCPVLSHPGIAAMTGSRRPQRGGRAIVPAFSGRDARTRRTIPVCAGEAGARLRSRDR